MKVLLLEDDGILNEILEEFLESIGYKVSSFYDGQEALENIYDKNFDLLILDINVPLINGFELCKNLKENSFDIPTILITASKTPDDIKLGFNSGADDYIKKPFSLEELEARIDNLKRLKNINNIEKVYINEKISYDPSLKELKKDGKSFFLSKTESKVLEYFISNKDKVISIEEISLNNWSYTDMPLETTIRTYIKNLRKILGKESIINHKGFGYKLNF